MVEKKTIEQRIGELMGQLPYANKTAGGVAGFRQVLRVALLEVARDQRHACAESVQAMIGVNVRKVDAHQIVMNAELRYE
jgi:hypothetical protein